MNPPHLHRLHSLKRQNRKDQITESRYQNSTVCKWKDQRDSPPDRVPQKRIGRDTEVLRRRLSPNLLDEMSCFCRRKANHRAPLAGNICCGGRRARERGNICCGGAATTHVTWMTWHLMIGHYGLNRRGKCQVDKSYLADLEIYTYEGKLAGESLTLEF